MAKTKKKKQFIPPKRKQPIFGFVKKILRLIYKRPKLIGNVEGLKEGSIIVSNHCAKKGPVVFELYLPTFHAVWGAHEMLGNYKSRYRYLKDVFYMQKRGFGKVRATLLAAFEACFSIYFYRGLKVLPTYQDGRLIHTIKKSIKCIDVGTSVLIFPENSNEGYKEILTEFFSGVVLLAETYYKKKGKEVPVYPVYYHDKKKLLAIGDACSVQEYVKQNKTRDEIAEVLRNKVNDLYYYCQEYKE